MTSKYRKIENVINSVFGKIIEILILLTSFFLKKFCKKRLPNSLLIIKILGGGSLYSTLPILLGLKKKNKNLKIYLICSNKIATYANAMQIFDEIKIIRINIFLFYDALISLSRFLSVEKIISLEMHSNLVTLFQILFPGEKIISNYKLSFFKNFLKKENHFVEYKQYISYSEFYRAIYKKFYNFNFEVKFNEIKKHILKNKENREIEKNYIVLAPFCSDLAVEREIEPEEYHNYLLSNNINLKNIKLIGGSDVGLNKQSLYIQFFKNKNYQLTNFVGKNSLLENIYLAAQSKIVLTIDSGFNHAARFVSEKIVSFWGPTNPKLQLEYYHDNETIYYKNTHCSPCVHFTDNMICGGHPNNFCQKNIHDKKNIFNLENNINDT